MKRVVLTLLATATLSCTGRGTAQGVDLDTTRMLGYVQALSADSMEGRKVGTPGNRMAREYIISEFTRIGLHKFGNSYATRFTFLDHGQHIGGTNVVGYLPGSTSPDRYVVVTAHYDHLGVRGGEIYNGADDNASGTAAVMAMAEYFVHNPPSHSMIFAAFDAEESELQGAKAFVHNPPVPLHDMLVNVNLDMVSHADSLLFVAGTSHYPFLKQYVEAVPSPPGVVVAFGHDRPDLPAGDDWTEQSDHGAFHDAGIPFLYFGVEDHKDYHRPSDDFETINPTFYVAAVREIVAVIQELDANLSDISSPR